MDIKEKILDKGIGIVEVTIITVVVVGATLTVLGANVFDIISLLF